MESPLILTYNYIYDINNGLDITVDNQDNSHIVWRERTTDIEPYNDGTLYGYYNGSVWSTPKLIVEDPYNQKITYFNGKTYIMDLEKEPNDSVSAVLYQKDNFGVWYGTKLFKTTNFCGLSNLGVINNRLYALFSWRKDGVQYEIYFMKTKYPLSANEINNAKSPIILKQNFPNPFTDNTNISYTLNQTGNCILTIHNLKGELIQTLVNKKQAPGTYQLEWNGINTKGKKLAAGIYLYRLSIDNYRMTKSLIIN